LEGLIAKRCDIQVRARPAFRRVDEDAREQGQELVIGGYTPSPKIDALVVGYYDGPNLIYAAPTRNGLAQG
jgi:hypothetical protein